MRKPVINIYPLLRVREKITLHSIALRFRSDLVDLTRPDESVRTSRAEPQA